MPQQPVPADPGPEEDLAWLDRDPATAEERAAWLNRVCEHDEPPEPEEYEDFDPAHGGGAGGDPRGRRR